MKARPNVTVGLVLVAIGVAALVGGVQWFDAEARAPEGDVHDEFLFESLALAGAGAAATALGVTLVAWPRAPGRAVLLGMGAGLTVAGAGAAVASRALAAGGDAALAIGQFADAEELRLGVLGLRVAAAAGLGAGGTALLGAAASSRRGRMTLLAALAVVAAAVAVAAVVFAADPDERVPFSAVGAGAAAATAAGLVAFAFRHHVRYHASALLVAAYVRIRKADVLDHATRERIHRIVREEPGIHAAALRRRLGVGWGATAHHVNYMERSRLLVSRRDGRFRRFFLPGSVPEAGKGAIAALRNPTTERVAAVIRASPGITQKEVCARLSLSPSLVAWHVARLEDAGLAKRLKIGRFVQYYSGSAWDSVDAAVQRDAA